MLCRVDFADVRVSEYSSARAESQPGSSSIYGAAPTLDPNPASVYASFRDVQPVNYSSETNTANNAGVDNSIVYADVDNMSIHYARTSMLE